jgi:1-acyl-sn-glycerol-3-phosphate acyltransferase
MVPTGLVSPFKAVLRILLYIGFTVPLLPVQAAAVLFRLPLRKSLPLWYHRCCCRILGLRVECRGPQSARHPTLYVSNHASYFDIEVLGSLIAGSFVAKREVAHWPLFGWLAKLQGSVFIERRGKQAADHRNEMGARLEAGDDLILFAEGTSGDGNRVLPFKSALFSVASVRPGGQPLAVQPVSIAYTKLDGVPMGRYLRPFFAWYGDMDLAGHLWQAVGFGRVTVEVEFHPVVTIDEFASRKALCAHCQARVAEGVAAALAGRPRGQPAPAGVAAAEAQPAAVSG